MLVRPARPGDAAGIARVHVDGWRSTYPGIVPDAYLAGLSHAVYEERWRARLAAPPPGTCTFVVEQDGLVVGFAMGGPERDGDPEYPGELYAIYVLPGHQGRGAGRRLVAAVAASLAEAGRHALLVWVLEANASGRRFYEALGGRPVRRREIEIGGAHLPELGYGWRDVGVLTRRPSPPG